MRRLTRISLYSVLLLIPLGLIGYESSASAHGSGGTNAPEHFDKPSIVLLSLDGFRWDFPELQDTPAMDRMASQGLRAEALQPVYPALTFPNHFSIATGALPARHGLVANEFPDADRESWYHYKDRSTVQDGEWYLSEPIWVTAEKEGMVTAAYFFVGTEADVSGIHPTHWNAFEPNDSDRRRFRQVLDWLAEPPETRPHLITLYSEDVDDSAHEHGPESPETIAAIGRVDRLLGDLLDGIAKLPHGENVYILLVSDHGQASYDPRKPPLVLDRIVDLAGIHVTESGPFVYLWFNEAQESRPREIRNAINNAWDCGRAVFPGEAPASWKIDDSPRFPDLIVQADPGCAVISTSSMKHKITAGDHGWSTEMPEMMGVFFAMGPRIPAGVKLGVVHMTDIHPLMLSILGLTAPGPIDGDPDLLPSLLLPER